MSGIIKDKSSIALKQITISAGVIDEDFQGEIKILMQNHGSFPVTFKEGQKIAQILIIPYLKSTWICDNNNEWKRSERGENGFGFTGAFV